MGPVLLKMLPFVLGAIAPTMIGLVVIFLTGTRGVVQSCAFILGKYLFYVFWGLVALYLVDQISSPGLKVSRSVSEGFFLIAGLLLLILAVRNFFVEDDPDSPPPKFMTILAKLGPFKLFGLGIGISIIQPRFNQLLPKPDYQRPKTSSLSWYLPCLWYGRCSSLWSCFLSWVSMVLTQ